jgi:hypothetical protein
MNLEQSIHSLKVLHIKIQIELPKADGLPLRVEASELQPSFIPE